MHIIWVKYYFYRTLKMIIVKQYVYNMLYIRKRIYLLFGQSVFFLKPLKIFLYNTLYGNHTMHHINLKKDKK